MLIESGVFLGRTILEVIGKCKTVLCCYRQIKAVEKGFELGKSFIVQSGIETHL